MMLGKKSYAVFCRLSSNVLHYVVVMRFCHIRTVNCRDKVANIILNTLLDINEGLICGPMVWLSYDFMFTLDAKIIINKCIHCVVN